MILSPICLLSVSLIQKVSPFQWQVMRSPNGTINSDPERFPGGMKALADYIHSKGLKFGVYSAQHEFTCQRRPGSWMHEAVDVESYCDWGVDCARQQHPSSRPKFLP